MTGTRSDTGATQLAGWATAVAATFRGVAADLLARAQAQRAAGEISGAQLDVAAQRCEEIDAQAMAIDDAAFVAVAGEVARELTAIEDAARRLEAVRAQISTAKDVIGVLAKVIRAAGAVVTAITAPAAIPAAALAIGVAVTGIVEEARAGAGDGG
jgi:hypothetical protein